MKCNDSNVKHDGQSRRANKNNYGIADHIFNFGYPVDKRR